MRARHHFHIEYLGHSISATVQTGDPGAVEVLVDGKETGNVTTHEDRTVLVRTELPTEPPVPVTVRATPGPGVPRCLLLGPDETEPHVMAPRIF
ncbi:hypothetical protein SLA_3427 [Streptomyces laurentii]|uniref:Uncharacterized protein n=1 Tax=Streptomyces laurentii TaxID=39478 RepID=A0A160P129_STRLU|nr:hypothetical protein SLA_3427 [Streptomyces laurentii]